MLNFLKLAWNWMVRSSEDPSKVSRTLQAGIPTLILTLGWAHIAPNLTIETANVAVDLFVSTLVSVTKAIGDVVTLTFFVLKVWNTVKSD